MRDNKIEYNGFQGQVNWETIHNLTEGHQGLNKIIGGM